jgi:hypothetical protein
MKKSSIIIFLTPLLLGNFICTAQSTNNHWQNTLNAKHIISIVSINNEPKSELIGKQSINQEGVGRTISRDLLIRSKENKTILTMNINRIQQKGVAMEGNFEVDTDTPFPSNETEKSITDNYLQFIKNPLIMEISSNGKIEIIKEPKLPVKGQWRADLPKLNSCQELSGIIQSLPENGNTTWVDSLVDERQNGIFVSKYIIINSNDKVKKVSIKGFFIPNKIDLSTNSIQNTPLNGNSIQAKSNINSMNYEGELNIDVATHLIKTVILKVNKNITMSALGQRSERQIQVYYNINNEIK